MSETLPQVAIMAAILFVLHRLYLSSKYDTPKKLKGELVKLKDAEIEYPGHMAFANKGGEYFHGSRVALFKNVRDLNSFFEPGNAGHLKLVGELIPCADGILCVFTNKLSAEDMEDIDEWNRNQHAYFQEKRQARQAEKEEAAKAKLSAESEQKRLAGVGLRYEKRVNAIRAMDPSSTARKQAEKDLNSGVLPGEES